MPLTSTIGGTHMEISNDGKKCSLIWIFCGDDIRIILNKIS
jgi:hypothetical protein